MAILEFQCPHCSIKDIALKIIYTSSELKESDNACYVYMYCPRCKYPSTGLLCKRQYSQKKINREDIFGYQGDPTTVGWELIALWPKLPKLNIPEFLDPDVERAYRQAESNFTIEGNEESSGMMYRKALELGLKKIDPSIKGTLRDRIRKLEQKGNITRDIADWADDVRNLGNDAAHEDDPISKEDLSDLRAFTEMTMRYLFTMPTMTKNRRNQAKVPISGQPLP